ncbi:ribosome recycling factor [Candidatus Peregrinibacteria bacterium CG10_big_fil_rev_8_21_14_0_10_49_10]|nr:MAG: ribosome recycling factor [Candidatus Peregrinibacteria bacterium CG10_big_fil_rev_8_21_14_0_10_49_10]
MDARIEQFQAQMNTVLDHLHKEYSRLQTGRANAALVEHVMVEAYGQKQELRAVAGISIDDARTIVVQPWDKSIMKEVESALNKIDLGTSPVNDGSVIRINLPPMTEERRKEMVKIVHQMAEEARISIRQQRQDVHDGIKTVEKDEDRKYTLLEELEDAVAKANEKVEATRKAKEEEVMTV